MWRKFLKFCSVGDTDDFVASIEAGLNSYEEADDELRSDASSLRQLAEEAIKPLHTADKRGQHLSFDPLLQVAGCLVKMSRNAVEFIIKSEENVSNNEEFSSLVKLYLDSSNRTLEFCNALENGVMNAKISQLYIQHACKEFETEAQTSCDGDNVKSKYKRTLEELKKFEEADKPFEEDFFKLLKSVYEEQVKLLKELEMQRQKLDQKLQHFKMWKFVFATASVSVLVLSMVAATPPVVGAVLGVLSSKQVGSAWKWCIESLKKCEEGVKRTRDIVKSMEIATSKTKAGIENVRALVVSVQAKIKHLLSAANYAGREKEEKEFKLKMDEIKKELDDFVKSIERVGKEANKFIEDVVKARRLVIDHILIPPAPFPDKEYW